ncbi:MAG: helix-turn-helix domain-containing protein [Actinomycetota bacterium]|nr:helix-turn-helix domain-containing protein [Actinomycetota bacterium]
MVGERIADARRSRGLSIDDVAATTRLRPLTIEAIEDNDFSLCGGESYAIGHLRIIANVVGLDGDDLVREYRRR